MTKGDESEGQVSADKMSETSKKSEIIFRKAIDKQNLSWYNSLPHEMGLFSSADFWVISLEMMPPISSESI